ncbi:hypothetical protein D3C81_1381870 [compost metagenome]
MQGLPVGQQLAVARGAGLGQEVAELGDAGLGLVQAPGDEQAPGVQAEQTRRAFQQGGGQARAPGQQVRQVLFAGDPFLAESLQVVGGRFLLACAQGLFDGVLHLAGGDEHAAGAEVQMGGGGFTDTVAQRPRHGGQHPVPGAVLVQRHAEGLARQQALEEFGPVAVFPEVLAEAGGDLRQVRQCEQAVGFFRAQAIEQFVVEVFLQPAMVAAGGGRRLAGEVQAHAGAPALGFLPELLAQGGARLRRQQVHQLLVLAAIEGQLGGVQFQQLSGQ